MKHLPYINQYVLRYHMKSKITLTNSLTDMNFDNNFYLDPRGLDRLPLKGDFVFLNLSM